MATNGYSTRYRVTSIYSVATDGQTIRRWRIYRGGVTIAEFPNRTEARRALIRLRAPIKTFEELRAVPHREPEEV